MTAVEAGACRDLAISCFVGVVAVLLPACYRHHDASIEAMDAAVPVERDATRPLDAPDAPEPDAGPVCDVPVLDIAIEPGGACQRFELRRSASFVCEDEWVELLTGPGWTLVRRTGGADLALYVRGIEPDTEFDCGFNDCRYFVKSWRLGDGCSCEIWGGTLAAGHFDRGCHVDVDPPPASECYRERLGDDSTNVRSFWLGERVVLELWACPVGVEPW